MSSSAHDTTAHPTTDEPIEAGHRGTGQSEPLWAAADLVTPMAIRVMATLRIADHIAAGRDTLPALAEHIGVDVDALGRVLARLLEADVLSEIDGTYSLTALGRHLRSDEPTSVRSWLDLEGALGHADMSLVHMLHTVRTGEPGFPLQFGRTFWEDLSAHPSRAASFDALMAQHIATEADAVAAAVDWAAWGNVVDVGGGGGTLLTTILSAHPTLHGTVVDLPGPVTTANATIEAAGLTGRAQALPGSFFDPLPTGPGAYLLSEILHDWDDDDSRRILRRCADAAGPDGGVFVVEGIGADGEMSSTELDLRMLVYFGGRERSLDQLTALADGVGLRIMGVTPAHSCSIVKMIARS